MKARTLLVLTAMVAVLGAFIFFVEKDLPSTDERAEREKKVLVFEQEDVASLEITWGEEKVRLERLDPPVDEKAKKEAEEKGDIFAEPEAEWRLRAPFEARADKSQVDSLLSTLASLERERTVEGADRSELGFDEARGRLTLATDQGEMTLEIGPDLPASNDILVAVGEEISQVSSTIWDDLTKEPGDWRDKRLFTASRPDITGLTLTSGEGRVRLARRDGDDFWLESPLSDLADKDLMSGLLTEVTGLRVASFLDEPPAPLAELGLEPAPSLLEVDLANRSEPFRLEVGHRKDPEASEGAQTLYARADGQVVELSTRLLESFAREPEAWRSRGWSSTQVFRIDEARFTDASGTVEITRRDSEWWRGEEKIPYSAASDVLYAVSDAKGEEVLSRAEAESRGYSLTDPALEVRLTTEDASPSLFLYPEVEGLSAALRDGRDAVLLLGSEAVEELRSKLEALRSAEPEKDEEEEESETEGE